MAQYSGEEHQFRTGAWGSAAVGRPNALNELERTNHWSRGLDAIRESRIACKDGFRDMLASIRDRLDIAAVKGQALDLCQELFLGYGARSDEEDVVLQNRRKLLD